MDASGSAEMKKVKEEGEAGPDLTTLRTFRVLRPLKLVSGVPSEFINIGQRAFIVDPSHGILIILLWPDYYFEATKLIGQEYLDMFT